MWPQLPPHDPLAFPHRKRAHRLLCLGRGECIIGRIPLQRDSGNAWRVIWRDAGKAEMDWTFELVAGPFEGLADAPVWDGEGLLFSLVEAGRIMRYLPGAGQVAEVRRYASRIRAMAFDAEGNLYGCQSG